MTTGPLVIALAERIKEALGAAEVDLGDTLTLLAMQRVLAEMYLSRGNDSKTRAPQDFRKQLRRLERDLEEASDG